MYWHRVSGDLAASWLVDLGANPAASQCLFEGASWWRFGVRVCALLCLGGILLVARWRLDDIFASVWVVSCLWESWWCWHGVVVLYVGGICANIGHRGGYFNGALHLRAQTQACTLVAHDTPSVFLPLLAGPREKAAWVACEPERVN